MHVSIIFGSNTGNTRRLARFMQTFLKKSRVRCTKVDLSEQTTASFPVIADFDLSILSASTWGGFNPTIQEDFAAFWKTQSRATIEGRKIAVIGLGDHYYPNFCKAVDIIAEQGVELGGLLVGGPLGICDPWEQSTAEITKWLESVLATLRNQI